MDAPMQVCFLCDDVMRRTGTDTYAVELVPRLQALGIGCKVFRAAGRRKPPGAFAEVRRQ
jgi:hypothetical protein